MRNIGIAMTVSILAAVAAMMVPASALESMTGASGLSELVPAAAAPLGDNARALIAFGTGALTLALMAMLLLRQRGDQRFAGAGHMHAAGMPETGDDGLVALLKDRLRQFRTPRLPWHRSDNDITDLADLPKLRGGDIHPDAPPRRPLRANRDLPALDGVGPDAALPPVAETAELAVADVTAAEPAPVVPPASIQPQSQAEPTLAEMVAQLEASVAQRQQQLAELELVAARLTASKVAAVLAESAETQRAVPAPPIAPPLAPAPAQAVDIDPPVGQARPGWRPLGVVPMANTTPDDMDEALASALATLHRMNRNGR
jgi:hypothetical protein